MKDKRLHDQLDDHFSDPHRKKLHSALEGVVGKNDHGLKKNHINRWRLIYFAVAAVFVFFFIYFILKLNQPESPYLNSTVVVNTEDSLTQTKPAETGVFVLDEPAEEKKRAEISDEPEPENYAGVDLSRYQPNAQLETLTQSYVRGTLYEIELTRTPLSTYNITETDPTLLFSIAGRMKMNEKPASPDMVLALMNNADSNQAIFEFPVRITPDSTGVWSFHFEKNIPLDYGLYYYFLESGEGDLLKGGQFRVDLSQ